MVGIVRSHRGLLLLKSEVGVGSTFTVAFPLTSEQRTNPAHHALSTTPPKPTGRALYVDDESPLREVGESMLRALGWTCLLAADGEEALQLYREHRDTIDVVMLDMTMPKMDGRQTLHALRELDPNVRVVLMSGFSETELREKFAEDAVNGTLQKPFDLASLRQVLGRAVK